VRYFKNLQTGAVVIAGAVPAGMWREVAEREYIAYRVRLARALRNLERAVAYKRALLRAE
jgi:hypothetical protein